MTKILVDREVLQAALHRLQTLYAEASYSHRSAEWEKKSEDVIASLKALLDQPDVPDVVLGLLDEIKGWKADQKENLKNQCDLQAEIQRLRVALKYIADIDRYDVRKITDTLPVYVYGQAGEVAHKALGETK